MEQLVAARLVTSDDGHVQIAHEALVRAWPRLRGWLDDDVEGQRIRHHLGVAADAWDAMGRPDSELYRGVRLAQALEWREGQDAALTDVEVAFLEESERNEQSEQQAVEDRARAQGRLIARLRVALAGGGVLLLVAVAAGVFAVEQKGTAEDEAAAAIAAQTVADARRAGARALATDDLDEAMLLAVAGVQLDDSVETRSSLLAVLEDIPSWSRRRRWPARRCNSSTSARTGAPWRPTTSSTMCACTSSRPGHSSRSTRPGTTRG